jgi:WD40 repeat protein
MSHIYLFHLFTGHSSDVTSVCFSPDKSRIVSGSEDKNVRIWIAVTGACDVTMEGM